MSPIGYVLRALSIPIAAVSLLTLTSHSLDMKLSALVVGVIAGIATILDKLILNAIEPYVASFTAWIATVFSWPISLQDHWKDTFILLNFAFFAKGRGISESNTLDEKLRSATVAAAAFPVGVLVALVVAVVSGTIPIRGSDWGLATLFALLPALGFFLYSVPVGIFSMIWQFELIKANSDASDLTRTQFVARQIKLAAVRSVAGGAIAGAVLMVAWFSGFVQPPALLAVLAQVLALALYWRARGERQAKDRAVRLGEDLAFARRKVANFQLGGDMLAVLGTALAMAVVDQLVLVPLGY